MDTDIAVASSAVVTPLIAGALFEPPSRDPAKLDLDAIRNAFDTYGAVVIKGCDIGRAEFVELTDRFGIRYMDYVGGADNDRAPGIAGHKTVHTVTGGSVDRRPIPAHGEFYYTPFRARTLIFCCIKPAAQDGQTVIYDGVKLWNALPEEIRRTFEERRVTYRRTYTDDVWHRVYQTDDIKVVRELCADRGLQLTEHLDGTIETVFTTYAYNDTPAGRSFINAILVWAGREYIRGLKDSQVRFEDGSELDGQMLYKIHDLSNSLAYDIPWEPGMVAIVDNFRVLHGRRAYEDSGRDIIMRMGYEAISEPIRDAAE